MTTRPLTVDDLDAILLVLNAVEDADGPARPHVRRRAARGADGRHRPLSRTPDAHDRDAVVGMVLVSLWPEDWAATGREEAWIDVVAVARGARGRGVAAAMLRRTLTAAHERGLTHASLAVDTENPTGAHRLYADLGFAPTSRIVRWTRPLEAGS